MRLVRRAGSAKVPSIPAMKLLRLALLCLLACLGSAPAFARSEAPELLRGRAPMPEEGLKNADGVVVLIATIDREGNVVDIQVKSATDYDLVQPCIDAMWGWKYTPAHRDGKPVQAKVQQRFRLGRD